MAQYIPLILKYLSAGVCIGLLAWMAFYNVNTPGAQALSALLYSILGALGLHGAQATVTKP